MQDIDLRDFLRLIPGRHIVIALLGSVPLGMGLMGFVSPPAQGALSWLGDYAGPLVVFGAIMGLPLYYSCARAALRLQQEQIGAGRRGKDV